jgi:hypothetical protein
VLSGDAPANDDLTPQLRVRLSRSLQAIDAVAERRTYRQIAVQVFGQAAADDTPWKSSSLRDTTIRLARTGRELVMGGYLRLLRPGRS